MRQERQTRSTGGLSVRFEDGIPQKVFGEQGPWVTIEKHKRKRKSSAESRQGPEVTEEVDEESFS